MIGTEETLFETIFMRYYALVYQLAYRCTGRRDKAEDIAQEVFLRFHHTPSLMINEEACTCSFSMFHLQEHFQGD